MIYCHLGNKPIKWATSNWGTRVGSVRR